MQATSAAFAAAVAGDHNVAVGLEILTGGQVVYSTTQVAGQPSPALEIIDGSVTYDKAADFRTRSTVKLVDSTLSFVPTTSSSLLTPWGNEIRLYRGVAYADGTTEMVRLCTNRISTVAVEEVSGGISLTVTGFGRERQVARNVATSIWPPSTIFGYPVPATAYTNYIRAIITNRYPLAAFDASAATWLSYQNDITVATKPESPPWAQENSDLWKQARNMADSVGCDLFADRNGTFCLIRDPNLTLMDAAFAQTPVASFIEGETSTFLSLKRILSDEKTWNQVICTGEGTVFGLPLRSTPAVDNDPNSPTNISSGYGVVTHMESNSLMTTQTQVNGFAKLLLRRTVGGQETVELPSIVDPRLDVDDVILIERERDGVVNVLYVIDSLTIPLRAEATMTIKTRERRSLR